MFHKKINTSESELLLIQGGAQETDGLWEISILLLFGSNIFY